MRRPRARIRLVGALFALVVPLLGAGPATAEEAEKLSPAERREAKQRSTWQSRWRTANQAVLDARQRHQDAMEAYGAVRHRNRRGETRRSARAELDRSEAAIAAAEKRLEDLRAQARRDGVPRGWLREAERTLPAAPTP